MPDAMGPLFVRSSHRATPNSEVVGSQLLIAKLVGEKTGWITHFEPPATRGVTSARAGGGPESEKTVDEWWRFIAGAACIPFDLGYLSL